MSAVDTGRRQRALRYLGYVASAGFVAWLLLGVLPELGDLDEAGHLLATHLRPTDVVIAGGLLGAFLLTHALTLKTAAPSIPLRAAIQVRAVAGGIGRFIPAGWAVGTAVMVRMLRSRGIRGDATAHAIAVTSVWNTLTKLLLPLLGVLAVAAFGVSPVARGGEIIAGAVVGVLALVGGLMLLARPVLARRLAGVAERILTAVATRTGRAPPAGLSDRAVRLQASTVRALRRRPLFMAAWYGAHHVSHMAFVYLGMRVAARGAGLEVGWPEVLLAFALGYLLTGLPISPGGLGTLDVVVVVVLAGLGEEAAVVSAGLAVYRIAIYALYVVALASWPLWRPEQTTLRDPAGRAAR